MKIVKLTLIALSIFIPSTLAAGSSNAELECRSIKGKGNILTLKGNIPGDYAEFSLVFKVGNKSIEMNDIKRDDKVSVVTNWKHHVFTIKVKSKEGYRDLVMYAIPNTVHVKKSEYATNVKFKAIAEIAPIPGYKGALMYQSFLHNKKMECTWEYSI